MEKYKQRIVFVFVIKIIFPALAISYSKVILALLLDADNFQYSMKIICATRGVFPLKSLLRIKIII